MADKVNFSKIAYSGKENKELTIKEMVNSVKSDGHCRIADDMLQRIEQNINDFKKIVDDISKSCFCSRAEAFKKIWPFYRKVFASIIIADENWQNLPYKKRAKIKAKTVSLCREFVGS